MLRDDVISRLIAELEGGIARVRDLLRARQVAEAETELTTLEQQIGLPPGIERFDAASAALMGGGGDRVVLAAMLLELRADAAIERGADDEADRHLTRALALLRHARPSQLTREAAELQLRLDAAWE